MASYVFIMTNEMSRDFKQIPHGVSVGFYSKLVNKNFNSMILHKLEGATIIGSATVGLDQVVGTFGNSPAICG